MSRSTRTPALPPTEEFDLLGTDDSDSTPSSTDIPFDGIDNNCDDHEEYTRPRFILHDTHPVLTREEGEAIQAHMRAKGYDY